ncbi:unnamed protein product [Blepharisma stoltei]|uniref:DM2 domain-containing protein n=1 Tax=Blepharisma stoltei TaxID=1481888 RepID=A0AAU9IDI9_9CILI|nr:unnamed protein product [Blepharisma stoltei]
MSTSTCMMCNGDLTELSSVDQVFHIDNCIDLKIETLLGEIDSLKNSSASNQTKSTYSHSEEEIVGASSSDEENSIDMDTTGMPNFEKMNKATLAEELDKFGLKKSLETHEAKQILTEIWLYVNKKKFPNSLRKYKKDE